MENILDKFKGRYHASPDAVMNIVSGDAYFVFSRIIAHPKTAFFQDEISISQRTLHKLTGLNERTIKKALIELDALNILSYNNKFKGNTSFVINWEEIYALSNFSFSVSYFGLAELRELCNSNKQYHSFTSLDKKTINELLERYKYNPQKNDTVQNTADNTADEDENTADKDENISKIQQINAENDTTAVFCAENVQNTADEDKNMSKIQQIRQNNSKSAVFCAENVQNTAVVCNQASHYIRKSEGKYILSVILSNAESIISEEHDVFVELVQNTADEKKYVQNTSDEDKNMLKIQQIGENMHKIQQINAKKDATAVFCAENVKNTAVGDKSAVLLKKSAVQCTNNNNNNNKYNKKEIIKENFDVLSRKNQSSSSGDSANLIFFEEPSSFSKIDNSQSNIQQNDESNSQKIFEIEIETSHFDNNVDNFLKLRKSEKYLSYEKFELDDILSNPTEHQLPEEKLIQEVWKELENEKEYFENEDSGTSQNQFTVDALGFIKNYLLRIYFDLKENTEDLQLTIQEAYSIFGFDVTTGEDGEALFIIQPDKIKNIAAKVSANKKHKMTSKETRELNIAYMDELIEIGTKHPDKFTEVFSAMDEAMFDFYEQTKELSQIHKIKLNEIVDRAIDQLGIEREDFIKALNLKEDSHKTYSLRYDFASAERVIEWNKAHNQESQVEREVNKPSQKRF